MRAPPGSALFTPALALLLALAGCGSAADGDPQLTVYLSTPLSGPRATDGQDAADGAKLALEQAGGEAGGTAVALERLDDANGGGWDAALSGANARTATEDSTAIAYVGELDSGASRTSVPITNEAGILQVSPGSTAEDLTRDTLGSSEIPSVQPSGTRSFGRVIPSDRAQGEAAAGWMSRLGLASVTILGAQGSLGQSLVSGFEAAGSPALVERDAEAVYLVEDPQARPDALLAEPLADVSILDVPKGATAFGSDALLGAGAPPQSSGFVRPSEPGPPSPGGPISVRVTSAALDPSQLPPAAQGFLADFRDAYGRAPGRYAAYGYEAMAVVLDSVERADDPLDRSSVVDAFFATSDRDSILGSYSIDEVGNTTLPQLGAYEVGASGRVRAEREPLTLP